MLRVLVNGIKNDMLYYKKANNKAFYIKWGVKHTTDDLYDYVLGVLDGKGTPFSEDAIRTYVDRSGETIDWLVDLGVPFAKFNMRDFSFNTDDGSAPGPHMVNSFKKELDNKNVDYLLNTKATSIIMEDGKAVGVEVEGPNGN